MNDLWAIFAFWILLGAGAGTASAIDEKPDYKLLNRVAACQSVPCVLQNRTTADSNIERTVLYTRWLMIEPSSAEASRGLLENMPSTDHEVMLFFTLPDWHDGATTADAQMERLDHIYQAWPRLLGRAAQRWPKYLPAYIRYGRLALDDIHSDYTGYERKVCEANRGRFLSAFHSLSDDDQAYIRKFVFDPDGCKPIFASEAE